ncbi:MAG TPA: hypothetical protein VIJ76_08630, partial [Galbitalea sp.]
MRACIIIFNGWSSGTGVSKEIVIVESPGTAETALAADAAAAIRSAETSSFGPAAAELVSITKVFGSTIAAENVSFAL